MKSQKKKSASSSAHKTGTFKSSSNNRNTLKSNSTKSKKKPINRGKSKSQASRKPASKNAQTVSRKRNSSSKSYNEPELQIVKQKNKLDTKKKAGPVQCLGPECINQALDKSKYCSEECGLSLAKNRLTHFLKSRIQQYNESPSFSKLLNETELERINSEVGNLRTKLKELEQKHLELDKIIDQTKNKNINLNVEVSVCILIRYFE